MPGINVSALSGGDLRRLLKVAHARRDGLLADRLEWEIAARATSGGRAPAAFASLPDDEEDEPVGRIAAPGLTRRRSNRSPRPRTTERESPRSAPRGVVLVTLGAVAGSLLSATVFWGLERMDMRRTPGRAEPPAADESGGPVVEADRRRARARSLAGGARGARRRDRDRPARRRLGRRKRGNRPRRDKRRPGRPTGR